MQYSCRRHVLRPQNAQPHFAFHGQRCAFRNTCSLVCFPRAQFRMAPGEPRTSLCLRHVRPGLRGPLVENPSLCLR
eukprot:1424463-Pyramimonas_sp.AAC.1